MADFSPVSPDEEPAATEPRDDGPLAAPILPETNFLRWQRMLIAAQAGDRIAYEKFLGELKAWLLKYYRVRLPIDAIEDAAHEVLLAVHAKKQSFDASRPFGPWLSAIVRYKWIDWLRQVERENAVQLQDDLSCGDHGPRTRSAILLAGLIDSLSPAQAAVIRLVKLQGATIEEAAATTGQSAALVKVNIHRAIKRMSSLLELDLQLGY